MKIGIFCIFDNFQHKSAIELTHLPNSYEYVYFVYTLYGPHQANMVLIAYASSEGSGEPAHPRSLARTSPARSYKH